jgi:aminopeptidase N
LGPALMLLGLMTGPPTALAGPGPADFDVLAYDLQLSIDRGQKRIAGRQTIRLRGSGDRLAVIVFPRNGIEVLSVTAENGEALRSQVKGDRVEIWPPSALAPGQELSFAVQYVVTAPKGVVFAADVVHTSFHTCHWMLCRDRPDDKANFSVAIDVPAGLTMVASGAPIGGRKAAVVVPGRQVWRERIPSSPYLFGFAIGHLSRTVRRHRGVSLEYFSTGAGDQAWLSKVAADDDRMLDFFVEKAGRPFPRPFYRQVIVDGDAAQEMTSFSVLGRRGLEPRLTDPTEDWLMAHEMAHQFWGNLVTCADWSHFWLNEGLTVFMVAAYKERRWGRQAYDRELGLLRDRHRFAVEARFDVPLTFAGEYPSLRTKRAIVYSKGALFVARLREIMGERPFWRALARYTRRFAGQVATTQDFQRLFAAETDKDLSPLFDEWAYGGDPGRPTLPSP